MAKRIDPDIVLELRELLKPEKIKHEQARIGSRALIQLSDETLYGIFDEICLKKREDLLELTGSLADTELPDADRECLHAAIRRLRIVGGAIAMRIKVDRSSGSRKDKSLPRVDLSFNPGSSLAAHVAAAKKADKNIDCLQKMSGLATLLEHELDTLYVYPTREAQPFMGVKHVNMVAQTYMNTLSTLHKMQMDVGIVEKMPEKMEVNMRQQGAFQTYIGEMTPEHRDAMVDFADSFCKCVETKVSRHER